ncbi:MAG: LapA family protein [Actinomycetia bacterium]|nr:LapA family protein [Actinomycetes bacterium]
MSEKYDNYLEQSSASNRRVAGLIVAGIIVAATVVFLLQNTEEATVKFLFLSREVPIYIVIIISMVLGALLTLIAFWLRRRAKKRKLQGDD